MSPAICRPWSGCCIDNRGYKKQCAGRIRRRSHPRERYCRCRGISQHDDSPEDLLREGIGFPIADAARAYDLIQGKTGEAFLGVLVTYSGTPDLSPRINLQSDLAHDGAGPKVSASKLGQVSLGVVGAGNFANGVLLPALKNAEQVTFSGLASGNGVRAQSTAERFRFSYCTSSVDEIFQDPAINAIAIVSRHHLHAPHVIAALQARKHVFVEKPLCLNKDELGSIISAYAVANRGSVEVASESEVLNPSLTVGFNRRFAPFIAELKQHLEDIDEPLMLHYRINAGFIPADHWTQDPLQGGGRLLGEACHFIDLLIYLAGQKPVNVTTRALPDMARYSRDNLLITIEFSDGSLGTATYVA